MKLFSLKKTVFALIGLVIVVVIAAQMVKRSPSLHNTEGAVRTAVDAYIYGYPVAGEFLSQAITGV